jgi:hypothetical protein
VFWTIFTVAILFSHFVMDHRPGWIFWTRRNALAAGSGHDFGPDEFRFSAQNFELVVLCT